jgi:hypothetical protein
MERCAQVSNAVDEAGEGVSEGEAVDPGTGTVEVGETVTGGVEGETVRASRLGEPAASPVVAEGLAPAHPATPPATASAITKTTARDTRELTGPSCQLRSTHAQGPSRVP